MTLKEQVLAHWKRLRNDAQGVYEANRESPGPKDCAFCQNLGCTRCPIRKNSGLDHCLGTPYNVAQAAWVQFKESGWDKDFEPYWQLKANAMIKFLESLEKRNER